MEPRILGRSWRWSGTLVTVTVTVTVVAVAPAACGGSDWEEICDDFKAKASACSAGTQSPACNPDAYEECDNEQTMADKFDECTAIIDNCASGEDCCPAWADCFVTGLPECEE